MKISPLLAPPHRKTPCWDPSQRALPAVASLEFFLRSLRSRRMAATNENPCSPEFTKEEIEAYTPSNESEDSLDFFGRRRLRIMNGQDPVLHPKSFTPLVSQRMQWPTNDEAFEWAEPARKKRALFNTKLREKAQQKNLKTPCAAGSSSTPITDENLIQQPAPPPVAVPFSLPCQ